jgi:GNAT superfamily N-acetyltransferase
LCDHGRLWPPAQFNKAGDAPAHPLAFARGGRGEDFMVSELGISWCDAPGEAEKLGRFFADNLTPEYISHSELMGERAIAPGIWSGDIAGILARDFAARCGISHGPPPVGGATRHAIAARLEGKLVGVAMLTFSREGRIPFGIIEDIVISREARGRQIGGAMMTWIFEAFRQAGLRRAFLESGGHNDAAHEFFARWGFAEVSVTMMAEIAPQAPVAKTDS